MCSIIGDIPKRGYNVMNGPRIGSGALIHKPEKMVGRKRKVLWFSAVHTFDILRYLNVTFIITMTGAY